MAAQQVNITVLNNPLGIAASSDGVCGVICHAAAVSTTFVLGTPYLLTKASHLTDLGITAANNGALYQHISEFYAQAGDGAKLWVLGVADSTAYATYVESDDFKTFIRSTYATDPLNGIKLLGLCYKIPTATQSVTDFNADAIATRTKLHTQLVNLFNEGYRLNGIIDGASMDSEAAPSDLTSLATETNYRVSFCITSSVGNGISSIGLLLGKLARISVGTSIGKVADGSINATEMYLTNGITIAATGTLTVGETYTVAGGAITYNSVEYAVGQQFTAVLGFTTFTTAANGYVIYNSTPIKNLAPSDIIDLGNKQFLFARTWKGYSGYFYNDGATAESPELALSLLEFNRIANKLSDDADTFFTREIGTNIPVDAKTGGIDKGYALNKQSEFKSKYIAPLITSNDISDADMTITGDDYTTTKSIVFSLKIVASPALKNVTGTVEFVKSL